MSKAPTIHSYPYHPQYYNPQVRFVSPSNSATQSPMKQSIVFNYNTNEHEGQAVEHRERTQITPAQPTTTRNSVVKPAETVFILPTEPITVVTPAQLAPVIPPPTHQTIQIPNNQQASPSPAAQSAIQPSVQKTTPPVPIQTSTVKSPAKPRSPIFSPKQTVPSKANPVEPASTHKKIFQHERAEKAEKAEKGEKGEKADVAAKVEKANTGIAGSAAYKKHGAIEVTVANKASNPETKV